jgi:oligopeptide/dipeptide ABC transporter ATP-binding protein
MTVDSEALLQVSGLTVDVRVESRPVRLVDGFDLTIHRGERVALVGESGSGKSVTARAIMRLDPEMTLGGSVAFQGRDLMSLTDKQMRGVRGSRIGLVFQDPLRSLNPLKTIGAQVAEPLRLRGVSQSEAWRRARETLDSLGVVNAAERMRAYPYEFSGGMRQRVALAIALVAEPDLLIADEPTTALDTLVQKRVLTLLDDIARDRGLAVLLITHDLGVVASFADRVSVMYSGRNVEEAPVREFYENPGHPYSQGLLAAVPRIDRDVIELRAMPGAPVRPGARPGGCAFRARCPLATERCAEMRPASRTHLTPGHTVACDVVTLEMAS